MDHTVILKGAVIYSKFSLKWYRLNINIGYNMVIQVSLKVAMTTGEW